VTSAPNYARELHPPLHRQTDRILVSIVGGACIWRGTLNSLTHWRQRRVRGMHDDLFHFRNNYLRGAIMGAGTEQQSYFFEVPTRVDGLLGKVGLSSGKVSSTTFRTLGASALAAWLEAVRQASQ